METFSALLAIHYDDVIMTMLASQITSLTVVYSIVYSGVIQRKHQSSASLAFVREIHRGPVNFPHKWPVTRKMLPFDDVIMLCGEFTGPRWIPHKIPVTRSFDVFFDLRLNKRLSKQCWGWWFETLSRPLWRHRNVSGWPLFSDVTCNLWRQTHIVLRCIYSWGPFY